MPAIPIEKTEAEMDEIVERILSKVPTMTKPMIRDQIKDEFEVPIFKNDTYQAALYDKTPEEEKGDNIWMRHLSIKRIDKEAIHDWRDIQNIKNDICGEDSEAVEIYPAEERHVDFANQYHLWVFPPGYKIPFGFRNGGTDYETERTDGTKQRAK